MSWATWRRGRAAYLENPRYESAAQVIRVLTNARELAQAEYDLLQIESSHRGSFRIRVKLGHKELGWQKTCVAQPLSGSP
jgi:hypothetical protein